MASVMILANSPGCNPSKASNSVAPAPCRSSNPRFRLSSPFLIGVLGNPYFDHLLLIQKANGVILSSESGANLLPPELGLM